MRPTVEAPFSPRPVKQDQFETWMMNEGGLLLSQLRAFANQREHERTVLTTGASGAYEAIWSESFPDDTAWFVTAHVVGRATVGGAARAAYQICGLFYREAAGALTQEGATTTVFAVESVAAFDCRFNISANDLRVQVLDDAVRTMDWVCVAVVEEIR